MEKLVSPLICGGEGRTQLMENLVSPLLGGGGADPINENLVSPLIGGEGRTHKWLVGRSLFLSFLVVVLPSEPNTRMNCVQPSHTINDAPHLQTKEEMQTNAI